MLLALINIIYFTSFCVFISKLRLNDICCVSVVFVLVSVCYWYLYVYWCHPAHKDMFVALTVLILCF